MISPLPASVPLFGASRPPDQARGSDAQKPVLLQLHAGELQLTLAPEVGGSIASFSRVWEEGGRARRVDWLRPATPTALDRRNPLGMASFPLVPFCNRIREGRAGFEGREIRFPPNHPGETSPHPLHGIGWLTPWQVVVSQAAEAELALEVPASEAWPWRFSARQSFSLTESQLSVHMSLKNEDQAAMPAGIGHHPYFPHTPGTRLTTRVAAMWCADAEVMPTRLEMGETVQKLTGGVVVAELDLDNNFIGWQREALVEWPADSTGARRSLVMEAEAPLDYFVLYCPPRRDHFCAEPVSQCTDWLNLVSEHGAQAVGGARIPPGETLEARFTLTPRWD